MQKMLILNIIIITGTMTMAYGLNTGFFAGIPHTFVNGIYESICNDMCFDQIKNSSTKGYDPNFLKIQLVKDSCYEALKSGYSMGFCDKNLGTL